MKNDLGKICTRVFFLKKKKRQRCFIFNPAMKSSTKKENFASVIKFRHMSAGKGSSAWP